MTFSGVESLLTLSVVISAGQSKDAVRELAVFLRNIEPDHIENGVLIVWDNESQQKISELRIKDRIAESTGRSVKAYTGVKFDQVLEIIPSLRQFVIPSHS